MIVLSIILIAIALCPIFLNLYAEHGSWTLPKNVRSSYDKKSKLGFFGGFIVGLLGLLSAYSVSLSSISLGISLLLGLVALTLSFGSGLVYLKCVLDALPHGVDNKIVQVPHITLSQLFKLFSKVL